MQLCFVCDNLSLCKICCIIYSINTGADIACQGKVESEWRKKGKKKLQSLAERHRVQRVVVNKRVEAQQCATQLLPHLKLIELETSAAAAAAPTHEKLCGRAKRQKLLAHTHTHTHTHAHHHASHLQKAFISSGRPSFPRSLLFLVKFQRQT